MTNDLALLPMPDPESENTPTTLPVVLQFVAWQPSGMLKLPLKDDIIIGRSTPVQEVDLDLEVFHARQLGVSRQHLRLTTAGDRLMIADLDSANGSYLDDQKMVPHYVYELTDGANLQLGYMKLSVYFRYE